MQNSGDSPKPVMAAVFNFFAWGTGYAYAGVRNPRGIPWILGILVQTAFGVVSLILNLSGAYYIPPTSPLIGSSLPASGCGLAYQCQVNYATILIIPIFSLLISFGLAFDGYKISKVVMAPTTETREARRCPKCASPVAPTDEFCQNCGQRLGPAAPSTGKRCSECGMYNPDVYGFCQRCGAKIG